MMAFFLQTNRAIAIQCRIIRYSGETKKIVPVNGMLIIVLVMEALTRQLLGSLDYDKGEWI